MGVLAGISTEVLQEMYWTMPVHTDDASARLDIIQAELVVRGVGIARAVSVSGHCDNIGICPWCDREAGDNHLCEMMCDCANAIIAIAQRRKEALA